MKSVESGVQDRWGLDPEVRKMRNLFRLLEKRQWELLGRQGISEFDPRLAAVRKEARLLVEKGWILAARQGLDLTAANVELLYENIMAGILDRRGLLAKPHPVTGPCGTILQTLLHEENR